MRPSDFTVTSRVIIIMNGNIRLETTFREKKDFEFSKLSSLPLPMLRINHAFYTLSDLASELSVGWDEAFCQLINSNHSDRFLSAFGKGSISRKGPCDLRDNYLSVRGLLSENPASPIPACQFF